MDYKKRYFESQQREIDALFDAERGKSGSVFEYVDCPICSCRESFGRYNKLGFSIVVCEACAFVYTNPRVSEEAYKRVLTNSRSSYFWAKHQETPAVVEFNKQQYQFFFSLFDGLNQGVYLDIGASTGICLDLAREKGFATAAIEWNETARDVLRGKGHKVFCDWDSFGDSKCEWISFYEVLEHQHDPKAFLVKVWEALAPGGVVTLSVPNVNSFACLLMGEAANSIDGFQHLNYFSEKSLSTMFLEQGFSLVHLDTAVSGDDQLRKFLAKQKQDVSDDFIGWLSVVGVRNSLYSLGLGYRIRAAFKKDHA